MTDPSDVGGGSEALSTRSAVPYLSFETFRKFVDELGDGRPVPPRIDRSLMMGMAGGTQTLLLGALAHFGLLEGNRAIAPAFMQLLRQQPEQRKSEYAKLLRIYYSQQLELSAQQGTADQLAEVFRQVSGYQGSTLRKAITFFLNMAKFAEVELSPYFRPPPQSNGSRRPRRVKNSPVSPVPTAMPTSAGESRTVTLHSGGTVTVSCSTTFLELSREDRAFVFHLVDKLLDYEAASAGHADGEGR